MAEIHDDLSEKRDFKSCTFTILRKIDPPRCGTMAEMDISLTHTVHKSGIFEVASRHASIHSYWENFLNHIFRTNHRESQPI